MNFENEENGYSRAQVDRYLKESYSYYTEIIKQQKKIIDKLKKENRKLAKEIKSYGNDKAQIAEAIRVAMEKTNELNRMYAEKVQSELNTLRTFRNKWATYYRELSSQYPVDYKTEKAGEIDKMAADIVDSLTTEDGDGELFDYEKAIHPTESLSEILETFGLGPEDKSSK